MKGSGFFPCLREAQVIGIPKGIPDAEWKINSGCRMPIEKANDLVLSLSIAGVLCLASMM